MIGARTRVTFLCGMRTVADYIHKHDLLVQAAAHYSTDVAQVPELMGRGLAQVKALQRRVDELITQLVGYEVGEALAARVGCTRWPRWVRSNEAIVSCNLDLHKKETDGRFGVETGHPAPSFSL